MLIHKRNQGGSALCNAQTGGLSNTGIWAVITCPACLAHRPKQLPSSGKVYAVKCDECKKTVSFTYELKESYAGTVCRSCHL